MTAETAAGTVAGPVHVTGELLSSKRSGAYHHVTLVAPGVAERYRPGARIGLGVGGAMTDRLLRRMFAIFRTRVTGAHGGTIEIVVHAQDDQTRWLVTAPAGTTIDIVGPVGRPFALPKEPVTCVLVGDGAAAAQLFGLADRLRERSCVAHILLGGASEAHLFGTLEARRAARTVTVTTEDGSVGIPGRPEDVLADVLTRTGAAVVYAAGPRRLLHAAAHAAEAHGAWSQTALDWREACGTGMCQGCVVPVVGAHGVPQWARSCTDGPVFRGDRVRWDELADTGTGAP